MVLISIRLFAFRKIFLFAATLFCLSSALCVADSLFMSLHLERSSHQAYRLPAAQLSVPLIAQPVASIALMGSFAPGLNRIFSESFVSGPPLPGPADVLAGTDERSFTLLWPQPASSKYQAISPTGHGKSD
jgi:hypothetical protein